jgi:two-component system cell cycle sensor histidine kinase/response regulator CckA
MGDRSGPSADLLDTLPTGLTIHVGGRVVYANSTLLRMVGASSLAEVLGRPIFDFIHPDFHELTRRRIRVVYEKGAPPEPIEILFLRLDGSSFDVEISATPIDWEGRPASQVVVTDTTRRRKAERAQHESEQRYRRLLERLPIGVVIHSQGRTVYANAAAARLIGLESSEGQLGTSVLERIHPDDRAPIAERIRRVYAGEELADTSEARLVRADGSTTEVEFLSTVVEWDGVPASQVLVTDLGPRKRAEAERRALEQRLWQAQKLESLAVLAGGVAHDFNNLLVGILGNADLARFELPPGGPVRTYLDDIERAARRAADLARQMLAYAGRGRVAVERIDLRGLLRETAGLLGAAVAGKARVVFRLDDEVPPVEGDATQLRQVAMNLITNAAEALEPAGGTITISAGAQDGDEALPSRCVAGAPPPGRCAFLEVADDGPGMSEEIRARIFDPFFSTKRTGRGLGLPSVLGIVRAHHGAILLDTGPARGSAFRVLLPAAPGTVPRAEGIERRETAPASAPGRRAVVLVVDDEESVREVSVRLLERAGFTVLSAADGLAAVDVVARRSGEFDLVLLDQTMPQMDGLAAFAALRRIRADLPVVLCSGYGSERPASASAPGPPPTFLPKPFSAEELLAAVREALA